MREIKFRTWEKSWRKMCIVESIDFLHRRVNIEFKPDKDDEDQEGNGACIGFEDLEIMQFTGLKDKNGKEIYEGDILWAIDGTKKVIFSEGCFQLQGTDFELHSLKSKIEYYSGKVIGNIYENPELLTKRGGR